MKFLLKSLIISSVWLIFLFSQDKLKFQHYTLEHGLTHPTVQSIFQDNKGFLWIGTKDGLNKYDGYKFYNYKFEEKDTNSISDNFIRIIFQDKDENIWIGTSNGLNRFVSKVNTGDKITHKFHSFFNNENDINSLSNNDIRAIYQTKRGDLWIGTSNGLNKISYDQINKKKIKSDRYFTSSDNLQSFGSNVITSIIEEKKGNLWVGSLGGGLNKFDIKTGTFINYSYDEKKSHGISSNFIMTLYLSKNNILWIGTYNGGLVKFNYKEESFKFFKNISKENSISDNRVFDIKEDKNGNLWLAAFGGGINKFNPDTEEFEIYSNDKKNDETIRNNFVRSLFIDRSDNLWAGTNEGLEKTNLNPPKFYHFKNNPWDLNSLQDNHVLSILEDNQSNIWIGTNTGLDKYDLVKNEFVHYKIDHNTPRSEGGFVQTIFEDKNKDIWIGTFGGGLYKYDRINNNFKQFLNDPLNPKSIIDNRILSLIEDQAGNILIGSNAGICILNKNTNEFSSFISDLKNTQIISGKRINVIYRNKENIYWIGTPEGLIKIDKENICTPYFYDENDSTCISRGNINSIYEDSKGNLWIATDNGLNLFEADKEQFIKFTVEKGLAHNGVTKILEDDEGNIWLSTQLGLTKLKYINKNNFKIRNYDLKDGLGNFDFNDNSGFKGKDDKLYFGGMNGFTILFPSRFIDNKNIPSVVLTSFKKFDKEILSSDELTELTEMELSYTDKFFSFEFSALDFTSPEKNKYAYKLEGFDDDWNYSGSRRFASYTNIDPGEYIFKVMGSNNDGIWNEENASIRLIITPPFYRTFWAYLFYSFLFVAVLYSLRKYELNKRKRKEELLIKEEREKANLREVQLRAEKAELQAKAIEAKKEAEKQQIRNRIASDLHDEIGSNLSSIILLSSNIKSIDKENEKYIKNINQAAKISSEAIREIIWFINPSSDDLDNMMIKMKETAHTMLSGIQISFQTNDIKNIEKLNPDLKRNIYLIYKEILANIIKHSKSSEVLIAIKEEDENFYLKVKDNGIGFNKNLTSNGNGLKNLENRAKQINGSINIKSELMKGTEIFLKVKIT